MLPEPVDSTHLIPAGPLPYQKILETLPGMHLVLSAGGMIQSVSDGYLQETLLEREAIVGKPLFEVLTLQSAGFASQVIESLKLSLQQALETKQAQQISIKRQALLLEWQGTNYAQNYYSVSHIPLLDEAGQVTCVIHQLENVTEKYKSGNQPKEKEPNELQAVARLQKGSDQLSTFFEQAPLAITILQGEEYVVELANPLVLDIWARAQEEVVGKPLFVAMPEIKNQGLEELLEGVRNSGRPHVGKELPIELDRHGKREKVYFNFVYHPLRDEQDIITGIAVVATDVSEQVVAREKIGATARQLQVLNEQLEELVAQHTHDLQMAQQQAEKQRVELYDMFMLAPAGIAILKGPELMYQMANQSFLEMVGRDSSIIGRPGRHVFSEVIGQGIWELMEEVYRSGKAYVGNEFRALIHMDGQEEAQEKYYNFVFQPINDVHGQTEAILITTLDVTDQVAIRTALEENAQRFNTLLESIPQMAWTATPEGELDYFNSGWYSYTGQSPEEALGNGWTRAAHPEDLKTCLPQWRHCLESTIPYQVECRYYRAYDQTWRWHLVRAVPLQGDGGSLLQWVGTCTDIHDQKLYSQQLLERETYFRKMADYVPMIIWMTRPDGYCTYLNKGWYRYTAQQEEEALGFGWLQATHPEDLPRCQEIFLTANARKEAFQLLYRLRGKDGSYRWFLDRGEPKYDDAGNFEGFVGTVVDVHEQKRSEDRLFLSVKAGKVGIWEWDTVNNRATYSHLLQEIFGFKAGELEENFENAYQVYQSIIHPDDWQGVNQQVEKAFSDIEEQFYIEFRIIRPSGEVAWIAERGEVIFEGGQPVRMNGTCIDITSRKMAEQALQQLSEELATANEELRAANEEIQAANEELSESNQQLTRINRDLDRTNKDLDNFVYTASHDLKAPILNLEGLLQALGRQLREEKRQNQTIDHIYELLHGSVARFKNTIRDLTQVAIINKENPEDIATLSLMDVFEEVRQDLTPQILETGAQIEINLDCPQVHFSRKNLKSIFYNLLSNALKYRSASRQPFVRISCHTEENFHLLTVEDNGLGMDMRQEDKIFALFKRLHTHVEGTGIGLYIVKKMLENSGGKIEVDSQVGIGSTFKVYFKR